MAQQSERYRNKYKNTRFIDYKLGDSVLCFDPKQKLFFREGKISSFNPPSDQVGSRNFMVEFEDGASQKLNQQWLVPATMPLPPCYYHIKLKNLFIL